MINKRINSYTSAFVKWKAQTQDAFEFSVLVCSAVPVLKRNIRLYEKGVIKELARPDYYGPSRNLTDDEKHRNKEQLKQKSVGYRSKLSKYILISNFSFFEAYVIDALKEMIDFHGGREGFIEKSKRRGELQIKNESPEIEVIRRKIRRQDKPSRVSSYKAASAKLTEKGYIFPSDLLSAYGARMLIQKISNMSANDIPDVLVDGLHMEIDDNRVLEYHNSRELRNRIAHGDSVNLTIEQVTNMSKALRSLVLDIDQHLLRYYFISENYLV
jgi:antitoxin component of MazEF toxin-antitoxin module